ncbi:hypothetical protein ACOMHN_047974 [Nucella lapillus]
MAFSSALGVALTLILMVPLALCMSDFRSPALPPCPGSLPLPSNGLQHITGKYYLRIVSSLPPEIDDIQGYALDVQDEQVYFSQPQIDNDGKCNTTRQTCDSIGNYTCLVNTPQGKRYYTLVAATSSVMAVWSETAFADYPHPALLIFYHTPGENVTLSSVRSQLEQFCGEDATDPDSQFYSFRFHYPDAYLACDKW